MQERYLGDSHDFIKYALLRHLTQHLNVKLGVNWYLTCPTQVDRIGNNDGEKRHHLKGGVWQRSDPELFEIIEMFSDPRQRHIHAMEASNILPKSTKYYSEQTSSLLRVEWHSSAMSALDEPELIFCDPDNGLEVASMTNRTKPKYALYNEIADYHHRGQAVVCIQFARQCDPVARAIDVRSKLLHVCGTESHLPIIRGRTAPNILFISVAPDDMLGNFSEALQDFVTKCEKAEIIF
jgi:hypothetical protein